ncbi:MAG: glycosyltransferase family 39 protein, partial [Thermoanaerobaculia bacterium]
MAVTIEATETPVRWTALKAAALLLLVTFLLGYRLGSVPLFDPDEGRNAEVAREMAVSGDFVLPTLNGLPYLDKPIVLFAAEAVAMKTFGANEMAARLPSLLFALATVLLIAWFGTRHFGLERGLLAGWVAAASPLLVAFSRIVIFDTGLTFFITFSILALYEAVVAGERRAGEGWRLAAWASMALGVLMKGPVALALPAMVLIPFAWRSGRIRDLASVWSALLFSVVLAPWLVLVSLRIPDFLDYALVTETVSRLTTNELKRQGPIWYFVPYLIGGFFPWILLLAANAKRIIRDERKTPQGWLFVLWIAVPFIFFSLSHSKRPQYILPLVAPIALLTALVAPRALRLT